MSVRLSCLYRSETRSSFEIEREHPSSDKQERFVQLLRRAGETTQVTEDWLVSLQNAVVRDVYSQEAFCRTRQNWLEDATGRVRLRLPVLSGFSTPVTRFWRYVRAEEAPHVTAHPGSRAYRFFNAGKEVAFLHRRIQQAMEEEISRELAWLSGYDSAFAQLDAEFDLPKKDVSTLIRMAQSTQGRLSARRPKQHSHLPVDGWIRTRC